MDAIRTEAHAIQHEQGFDPLMIAAIIQAIIAVMQVINDCRAEQPRLAWRAIRMMAETTVGVNKANRAIQRRCGTYAAAQLGGREFAKYLVQRAKNRPVLELEEMRAEAARFDANPAIG